MILGIGTDICNIERIVKLYNNYNQQFLKKILSETELQKFTKLHESKKFCFLAKRFAAKEAFAKALGKGLGADFNLNDITIINNEFGKPIIKLNDKFQNFKFNDKQITNLQIELSISDDYPFAVAFVVISI